MNSRRVVLLSIPGLRRRDLAAMPALTALADRGGAVELTPGFPCVTWPVQANMLTGLTPDRHGVIANGFYWRTDRRVEMWTGGNDKIQAPQIWDHLRRLDPPRASAVWFPMLGKGASADFICMPAPVHNPDGSEGLWCYSKPAEFYGELLEKLGHFPLQHFWGPLADIQSTRWIAQSAVVAAERLRPDFFFIYLPHLDYAAQKTGPDSAEALQALVDLDREIAALVEQFETIYRGDRLVWLAAGEYAITPVDHVSYPNRILREAGFLRVRREEQGEEIDLEASRAWALCDHQHAHVFVRDADRDTLEVIARLFRDAPGIAEVLVGSDKCRYQIDHPRSGELVLISEPNSWMAYYWWLDDAAAPAYTRRVDIHRKPGYDPVELHFDPASRSIPLDATLIRGSHGAPARREDQKTVMVASESSLLGVKPLRDVDIFPLVGSLFAEKEK